jgi:hypothetical protein
VTALDSGLVRESAWTQTLRWASSLSLRATAGELLAIVIPVPILLGVALWNGFPIIFYDTGAYILEGLGHVFVAERAPVYSLLLRYGNAADSLWYVAAFQALITAIVLVEVARAESPGMRVWQLVGAAVALCTFTGIAWYVGQIEPDCMTALVVLALYLLAFRSEHLGWARSLVVMGIASLAIAVHPAHLALAAGLLIFIAVFALSVKGAQPRARIALPSVSFVFALLLVLVANHELTDRYFISRSGSVFAFARMLQDGLIKPELDKRCATSHLVLCRYERQLPDRADAFLWDADSPFNKLQRFNGPVDEYRKAAVGSLLDFPLANVVAAIRDTAVQFVKIRTGDQIEPQEWILYSDLAHYLPRQMNAYMSARQQQGELHFTALNTIHLGTAVLSLIGLLVLLWLGIKARDWAGSMLPSFVLLALIGNAFVCGVFSNPHDRYQSRLIWVPTLICLVRPSLFLAKFGRIRHLVGQHV